MLCSNCSEFVNPSGIYCGAFNNADLMSDLHNCSYTLLYRHCTVICNCLKGALPENYFAQMEIWNCLTTVLRIAGLSVRKILHWSTDLDVRSRCPNWKSDYEGKEVWLWRLRREKVGDKLFQSLYKDASGIVINPYNSFLKDISLTYHPSSEL